MGQSQNKSRLPENLSGGGPFKALLSPLFRTVNRISRRLNNMAFYRGGTINIDENAIMLDVMPFPWRFTVFGHELFNNEGGFPFARIYPGVVQVGLLGSVSSPETDVPFTTDGTFYAFLEYSFSSALVTIKGATVEPISEAGTFRKWIVKVDVLDGKITRPAGSVGHLGIMSIPGTAVGGA